MSGSRTWPRRTEFLWILTLILFSGSGELRAREVQSHGFRFEQWLRESFFAGPDSGSYTRKWDIPAEANLRFGGIPVNPKAAKFGSSIALGDALRQFEIDHPFLLVVGFWDQPDKETKAWVNVQAVRIEPDAWRKIWGEIQREDLQRLIEVIEDRSLSIEETRAKVQELKAQPPFPSAPITLNPKIDKAQRRLQCSLRFHELFDRFLPQANRDRQSSALLWGRRVPDLDQAAPRTFRPEN